MVTGFPHATRESPNSYPWHLLGSITGRRSREGGGHQEWRLVSAVVPGYSVHNHPRPSLSLLTYYCYPHSRITVIDPPLCSWGRIHGLSRI